MLTSGGRAERGGHGDRRESVQQRHPLSGQAAGTSGPQAEPHVCLPHCEFTPDRVYFRLPGCELLQIVYTYVKHKICALTEDYVLVIYAAFKGVYHRVYQGYTR